MEASHARKLRMIGDPVVDAPPGMQVTVRPGTVERGEDSEPYAEVISGGVRTSMTREDDGTLNVEFPEGDCTRMTSEELDHFIAALQECRARVMALPDEMDLVLAKDSPPGDGDGGTAATVQ